MKITRKTDTTIISTNLNDNILDKFPSYYIFKDKIDIEELKKHDSFIFYNILHLLTKDNIRKIIKYLRANNKNYIIITNNMEHTLLCNYLIVINEKDILIEGKTLSVLKESKLLKRLGFNLPFIIDLSLLLNDYGLVSDIYLDKSKLIGELWN